MGDQLFTDVFGARRTGIHSILVKPIHPKEEIQIVLKQVPGEDCAAFLSEGTAQEKIRKESKKQEAAAFSSKAAAFVLVLPDNLTATDRVVHLPVELPAGKRCIFSLGLIY